MTETFLSAFLKMNLGITFFLLAILYLRKVLEQKISPQGRYLLWIPILTAMALPFFPLPDLLAGKAAGLLSFLKMHLFTALYAGNERIAEETASLPAAASYPDGFWSLPTPVAENSGSFAFQNLLLLIWICGMAAVLFLYLFSAARIRRMIHCSRPVHQQEVCRIFLCCKKELGMAASVRLRTGSTLSSPVTAGLFHPCVLLPETLLSSEHKLPEKELRFIFLHELQHIRRKDAWINLIFCLIRTIYWFHPLLRRVQRELAADRELACDTAVLKRLPETQYRDYGAALLSFAERNAPISSMAIAWSDAPSQLKQRIQNIVSYRTGNRRQRKRQFFRAALLLLLLTALAFGSFPFLSLQANASGTLAALPEGTIESADFSSCFQGKEGTAVFYDSSRDTWQIYRETESRKRTAPNSTYKIYSALAALDGGVITPEENTLFWDGSAQPFSSWEQDQTLRDAMQNSVNWYFQALDEKTGLSGLWQTFRNIRYGNMDLSGGLSDFWAESSLRIAPVEQADLLRRLFGRQLPFSEDAMQSVEDALYLTDLPLASETASLYGKTGSGRSADSEKNGWFIGCAKSAGRTITFAVYIQDPTAADGALASETALRILQQFY